MAPGDMGSSRGDAEHERGQGAALTKPPHHHLGGLVRSADPAVAHSQARGHGLSETQTSSEREGACGGRAQKLALPAVVEACTLREVVSTPNLLNSFN